ncbi:MAG: hypothetical protein ABSH20_14195 [Tepidisphaeraceae bacterium]
MLNYERAGPASVVPPSPPLMSLQRYMTLVGWALLVTTLGQMMSLGEKPIRFLLKDQLGLSATQMAMWIWLAILPWSLKPIAGLMAVRQIPPDLHEPRLGERRYDRPRARRRPLPAPPSRRPQGRRGRSCIT